MKAGAEASRLSLRDDFSFAVTDPDEAAEADLSDEVIEHTREQPFLFHDTAKPTLFSFYVQDSIRASNRLTVDLGLRADWSRLLTRASQWSPRVGASYHWPSTQTTLGDRSDGSSNRHRLRIFSLLRPKRLERCRRSPKRRESAEASLLPSVKPRLKWPSIRRSLGPCDSMSRYWRRRIQSAGDPNVFFGTTIIFPIPSPKVALRVSMFAWNFRDDRDGLDI